MLRYLLLALCLLFTSALFAQNAARFSDIKPGMKDLDIEREAVRLANKRAIEYHWPEEFWKAKIISTDWEDVMDCCDHLIARKIHLELYARMNSGRCAMADFTYKEKLDADGAYSRLLFLYDHIGDMVNVECEE